MFVGLALIVLGALSLVWMIRNPRQFAQRREHDREMPWIGNFAINGWTRKLFATLPLGVDRALQMTVAVLMIIGGIWYLATQ
jgi:hypothetical protein